MKPPSPKSSASFNFSSSYVPTVPFHKIPFFFKKVFETFRSLRKPLYQVDHVMKVVKVNLKTKSKYLHVI